MATRTEITTRRAALQAELRQLEAEEQRLASLTPSQELAEEMHERWCRLNHTDGCGWGYEGTDWMGHAHSHWHKRASAIMHEFPEQSVAEIIRIGALFR